MQQRGLNLEETGEIVQSVSVGPPDQGLAAILFQHTEGNPFYPREVISVATAIFHVRNTYHKIGAANRAEAASHAAKH